MRWTAAVVLAAALAARASAGNDATQKCRDAWAAFQSVELELPYAFGEAAERKALDKIDAARRRFDDAFAAAPWDAFDDEQDARLLDAGFQWFIADARARGDLAAARKGATTFVTRRWTGDAFVAHGLTLPELNLAAGDLDAAMAGFRVGVRQPCSPAAKFPGDANVLRGLIAGLRIGDILAACGDSASARSQYAALRKELDGRLEASRSIAATVELDLREFLGRPLPALPKCAWIGEAPRERSRRVVVVWAGWIGARGDAGRLRELERLAAETDDIDVRIVVEPNSVGYLSLRESPVIRVPRGPEDGEGEATAFDGKDVAGLIATIRERLKLHLPIGISTEGFPAPFGTTPLVLVADRSGTIIHASDAGEYTDWICGIARIVAAGKMLNATPKPVPSTAEALATCTHNLAVMAANFPAYAQSERVKTGSRVPRCAGPAIWFDLCVGMDDDAAPSEHFMLCPADDAAFVPTVKADSYLWDHADREHPPAGLCSYVGRDFVASPPAEDEKDAVLGACLHHPGGAVVARADGTVQFVPLKDLGIASDDEKTVGPESKSPLLRLLR